MRRSEVATASSTTRRVIGPGEGTHFVKAWISAKPVGAMARGELPAEGADEILGRAVMVGEVPGREPGIMISEHRVDRARRVDRAMRARHLPHPVQDAADRQIGGELEAAVRRQGHGASPVMTRIA